MTMADRLAAAATRRGGSPIRVNTCPKEMELTPKERYESSIRMRVRCERNVVARGGIARAF